MSASVPQVQYLGVSLTESFVAMLALGEDLSP
jgi:hypothetical protein